MSTPRRPERPLPVVDVAAAVAPSDRPSGAETSSTRYTTTGALDAGHLLTGDPSRYAHLDPLIVETTTWVQETLVREGATDAITSARSSPTVRAEITEAIDRLALQYLLGTGSISGEDRQHVIASVINEIVGLGPLEPLWSDPGITEVIVNGPKSVFVERGGKLTAASGCVFRDAAHLLETCQRILVPLNRKVDIKDPLADGRLPDGSRVNIVHHCLAPGGPMLTIRRFPDKTLDISALMDVGAVDPQMVLDLAHWVKNKATMLVAGGTGSGKALALDTLIPTPQGMTAIGELIVDDSVFSPDGSVVRVTGAWEVLHERDCYQVAFSHGGVIVADAEHLWTARLVGETTWRTVTTTDLLQGTWELPPVRAVQYPTAEVSSDPHVVGQMLGERWSNSHGNELPAEYLISDEKQRLDLLEGVIAGAQMSPEFTCHDQRVFTHTLPVGAVESLRQLITSLGGSFSAPQPKKRMSQVMVTFTIGAPPYPIRITDITAHDSVPVRCITVDHPDGLYLAGTAHTPTHNTTVLNALSEFIPAHERIITIEDALELRLHPSRHVAALEARPPDATGHNSVPIRLLVRNALRMRPDRIVVGEIRDAAAVDMLQACNTGHEGSLSTLHANGPTEALSRLQVMIAQGGEIPADKVTWLIADAIDMIVMVRRYEDGSRRVSGVYELGWSTTHPDRLDAFALWQWEPTRTRNGVLEGEYRKVGNVSEYLRTKLRLDTADAVTWSELGIADPNIHQVAS